MTAITEPAPSKFQFTLKEAFAYFEGYNLHTQFADDALSIDNLNSRARLDIDCESIPVLVGVHWKGDHMGGGQVHLPFCLDTDVETGEEKRDYNYDRVRVIDAAIFALHQARTVAVYAAGSAV